MNESCVAKIGERRDQTRECRDLQEVVGRADSGSEKQIGILVDGHQYRSLRPLIDLCEGVGKLQECLGYELLYLVAC